MPPSMLTAAGAIGEVPIDYASYETLLTSIAESSDRELHDNVAAILGKDMDAVEVKLVIDTRPAPPPSTASRAMRRTQTSDTTQPLIHL